MTEKAKYFLLGFLFGGIIVLFFNIGIDYTIHSVDYKAISQLQSENESLQRRIESMPEITEKKYLIEPKKYIAIRDPFFDLEVGKMAKILDENKMCLNIEDAVLWEQIKGRNSQRKKLQY